MRSRLVSLILVALVAGCGGSSKKSSAPETTTETTAATTAETETTATTTESTGTSTSFASSKNCLKLLGLSSSFAQAFAQSGANNDVEKQAKFFKEFADQTPKEIRSDFQLIAKTYSTFITEYSKLNLKPGATPTAEQIQKLEKLSESFNAPALKKASAHIEGWAKTNCSSG